MFWVESKDGDHFAYEMYRRHYSSAKNPNPKQRQFVGPGQPLVLMGMLCNALFVWRKERYRMDCQRGINCAVFRNESHFLSSLMILEAMDWAWEKWPGERFFTMIDASKVRSGNPGACFKRAGWRGCGNSKGGLIILECLPLSES